MHPSAYVFVVAAAMLGICHSQQTCTGLEAVTSYLQQVSPKLALIFRFRVPGARTVPALAPFTSIGADFTTLYDNLINFDASTLTEPTRTQFTTFVNNIMTPVIDTRLDRNQWSVIRLICQGNDTVPFPIDGSVTCNCAGTPLTVTRTTLLTRTCSVRPNPCSCNAADPASITFGFNDIQTRFSTCTSFAFPQRATSPATTTSTTTTTTTTTTTV